MMNTKKKISFALALLMSVSILATGCKKTDEETSGLSEATVSVTELTQMTTTTAEETTTTTAEETTTEETSEETTEETTAETTVEETSASEETTTVPTETTAAETTTATAATTAAKAWSETEISEVMYTTQACYSRKQAIVGAETVAQYKKGTKVNIVAATDTGYYKLADGSFIHSDYLTDKKPSSTTTAAKTEAAETTAKNPDSQTSGGNKVTSTSYNIDYTTRYGYKSLTSSEKELYGNIVKAAESLNTKVDVPNGLLSDDIAKVYGTVYNQEPQLFWLSSKVPSGYGSLTLTYDYTKSEIESIQAQIDKNVKSIMNTANGYSSTISKLKVFYDWIVKNNTFAKDGTADTSSISGGLTGDSLQCIGYAKSMMYLCDLAGIECMTIVGTNNEGSSHAWNVVYCDNGYYNLDATWGDPKGAPGGSNYVRYSFFLVPDEWIKSSHCNVNIRFKSNGGTIKYFTPPACTKTACNYYKAYNKEYGDYASAEKAMYAEFDAAIKAGKNVAEIRVTSYDIFDKLLSDSNAKAFQKYAKEQSGSVVKLARQRKDNEGVYVVQYNIFYEGD